MYVFNPENMVVDYMIKHIYNRSIADCLSKIMISEDLNDQSTKNLFVEQIIDSIPNQEYEGKLNASQVLTDIFEHKNYIELFKSEVVNRKLFAIVQESSDDLTTRCGFTVLNALYNKFPFFVPKESGNPQNETDDFAKMYLPTGSQSNDNMIVMPHIKSILDEFLPSINSFLIPKSVGKVEQQYGQTIKRYGATRIQVTNFILNVISQGVQEFALHLAPCLPTLLDQSVEYQWNSMLHNNVEAIFSELFKKDSKYDDGIRTAVIAEARVADYISTLEVDIKMPISGRYIRSGIVATFFSIANMLNLHTSEYVQAELSSSEKWNEFINTELQISNDNNDQALAGHQSKGNDSDEDSSNYETSMDKLFAQFTSLKESHDSSRELEDDDEEPQSTENILSELLNSGITNMSAKDEAETKERLRRKDQVKKTTSDGHVYYVPAKYDLPNSEPAVMPEEDIDEDSNFHDHSYWNLGHSHNLDDLLQDV
jgi:hypothetical protein